MYHVQICGDDERDCVSHYVEDIWCQKERKYLVQDLVHLLGFEDIDEAKEACRHFNICVKEMSLGDGSNNQIDVIFWRYGTGFKESKNPEKGTVHPLKPRKMNRIIETNMERGLRNQKIQKRAPSFL